MGFILLIMGIALMAFGFKYKPFPAGTKMKDLEPTAPIKMWLKYASIFAGLTFAVFGTFLSCAGCS
ncbi:hypothetical protein [Robertkochia solimangrovi]|uniref:hypothetical protein n=1 Tax=Robertkochia solimangrovi TaxID=2213046 RepID=UPI00117E9E83|nr:hypothetical protein [Robertkochia solimangrovi]TRZ46240.1 hypothetical protein DMZ48_03000 [Robertkochia solimangrovi]